MSAVLAAVIGYAARPQRIRFGVIPGYGVLVGGAGVYSVTLQVLDVWRHAATPAAGEGEARTRLAELRYPAGARRQITTGPGRGPPRG